MQDGPRRGANALEGARLVEIDDEGNDAVGAHPAHIIAIAGDADETCAVTQQLRDAQCDIAATHEQDPLRHDVEMALPPTDR